MHAATANRGQEGGTDSAGRDTPAGSERRSRRETGGDGELVQPVASRAYRYLSPGSWRDCHSETGESAPHHPSRDEVGTGIRHRVEGLGPVAEDGAPDPPSVTKPESLASGTPARALPMHYL